MLHPPADELGRAGLGATLQLSQLTMAIGYMYCVSDPKGGIGNPGSANSIETGLAAGHALAAKSSIRYCTVLYQARLHKHTFALLSRYAR